MITDIILLACLILFAIYHDKKIREKENNYQWIWECRDFLQVLVRCYESECRKTFQDMRLSVGASKYSEKFRALRQEYEQGLCEKITELSRRRNGRAINFEHIPDFLLEEYKKDLAYIEDIYREVVYSLNSR